jgi:hypothetical protein
LEFIAETFVDLDNDLSPEQKAIASAFRALIENRLYFAGLWCRWSV